ncbi:NAD-dependent epimerase/dehydratase family protein [Rhodococcus opacus]|uniref:NAD-dependent epimerase/dehydratase family protein n=1 Tax=Rhodococcus opacus TaxID=37919 RepID=UPI003D79AA24
MMVTLITGGTGMLRSAVVRGRPDNRRGGSQDHLPPRPRCPRRDVVTDRVDIVDRDDVGHVLEHGITEVVRLAAAVSMTCASDPVTATAVNCVGTANVLEECRNRAISRVVLGSTVAIYGDDSGAVRRPCLYRPTTGKGRRPSRQSHWFTARARPTPRRSVVSTREMVARDDGAAVRVHRLGS